MAKLIILQKFDGWISCWVLNPSQIAWELLSPEKLPRKKYKLKTEGVILNEFFFSRDRQKVDEEKIPKREKEKKKRTKRKVKKSHKIIYLCCVHQWQNKNWQNNLSETTTYRLSISKTWKSRQGPMRGKDVDKKL